MLLKELKALVKKGESNTLEFKQTTGQLSDAMGTVCAFLNSKKGGILLFGVTDEGKIEGQIVNDRVQRDIANQLNRIEPYTPIETQVILVSKEKSVVALVVKRGSDGPYVCSGRPYVRVQSTTKVMPQETYKNMLREQTPQATWESLTTNNCTMKDLDLNRIKGIIHRAVLEKRLPASAITESIPTTLKKLGLITKSKLTNAAVVLFCKDEFKQFMQSNVQLARFQGITKNVFLDSKTLRANAFDLFEKADEFLRFCLPLAAYIEEGNPLRVERPAIPYAALREALINAIIHRDYSHPGGSVAVAVYDDRVNISNAGFLPKQVTIKQLTQEHRSVPRNPLIAHVFYLGHFIEKWGRGTLDMIEECKKAGNPLPKFEEVGGGFSVTFPLKEPIRSGELQVMPTLTQSLSERQQQIVNILKEEPMTREQIMAELSDNAATRTVQDDLSHLLTLNVIIKTGESRGRFVKWALNRDFNARSMRGQRAVNARSTRSQRAVNAQKSKKTKRK